MKKRLGVDDDDLSDRLDKQNKKEQSEYMKQLTGLAQQTTESPPKSPSDLEPTATKGKRPVNLSFFKYLLSLSQFFLQRKSEDL